MHVYSVLLRLFSAGWIFLLASLKSVKNVPSKSFCWKLLDHLMLPDLMVLCTTLYKYDIDGTHFCEMVSVMLH